MCKQLGWSYNSKTLFGKARSCFLRTFRTKKSIQLVSGFSSFCYSDPSHSTVLTTEWAQSLALSGEAPLNRESIKEKKSACWNNVVALNATISRQKVQIWRGSWKYLPQLALKLHNLSLVLEIFAFPTQEVVLAPQILKPRHSSQYPTSKS